MLILYLVILISVSLVVLLIITNRTNLKIRFLIQQLKGVKQELNQLNEKEDKIQKTLKLLTIDEFEQKTVFEDVIDKISIVSKIKEQYKKIKDFLDIKFPFLEKFAGENVLDKIGMIVFIIGIAFFVSFSNEYKWINSIGQIFFTSITGTILIILSFFLRNKFTKFSAILLGGGIAILIITVFAAYYQYDIIGDASVFVLLIFLLSFGILVSLKFDEPQIAILVIAAGFISPISLIFASYQASPITIIIPAYQYVSLFGYIAVLNLAVIIFGYYKKSLFLNVVAYIFTFIFCYLGLVREILRGEVVPEFTAFIFLTLFYIMLVIILILNNVKQNRKFIPYEFTGITFGTAWYFIAGLAIINNEHLEYKGLFTGLIAILNFILVLILYKRKNYDKGLLTLVSAIVLVFATLIIPVELIGRSRAIFWSLQTVLFLWVSQKADLKNMKLASLWMTLGMLSFLSNDLYHLYFTTTNELVAVKPIFNKGFLTSMVAVASMIVNLNLLKNEKVPYYVYPFFKLGLYKAMLGTFSAVLFYFALNFEIKYYLIQHFSSDLVIKNYMGIFNFSFLFLLTIPALFLKKLKIIHLVTAIVGLISLLIYLFNYNLLFSELRNSYLLASEIKLNQFNSHYFIVGMLVFILIFALRSIMKFFKKDNLITFLAALIFVFGTIYLFSSEITSFIVVKKYTPDVLIQEIILDVHHLSYTILWCLTSLFFVIIGFLLKNKNLRTVSIVLYLSSIVKLFVFDFAFLRNQDLMIAFLTFGGVLLTISFVFQMFYNFEFDKDLYIENN